VLVGNTSGIPARRIPPTLGSRASGPFGWLARNRLMKIMAVNLKENLRLGLLGFFVSLAGLSLLLNGFLLYKLYRPKVTDYVSRFTKPAAVSSADDVRGDLHSKITLIEYSDFQCPFCQKLYGSLTGLEEQYHFRWVYREYPLAVHPYAETLAEAAECAGRQGKFWEFADKLYASDPPKPSFQGLTSEAQTLGLNSKAFQDCLQNRQMRADVLRQKEEGDSLWITGTPTFFVNGKRYVGALPPDQLQALLTSRGH
jgi:protein-disulfide isomerase